MVSKRYLPVALAVVLMSAVALAGYLRLAEPEEMPRRILFDSAGGKVIFSHLDHEQSYGIDCAICHHESENPGKTPLQCGLCHPPEFTQEYIADHQWFFAEEEHCERCHHTGVADGPCSSCHGEPVEQLIPTRTSAFHGGCMGCHERMQAGPYREGECIQCHLPR